MLKARSKEIDDGQGPQLKPEPAQELPQAAADRHASENTPLEDMKLVRVSQFVIDAMDEILRPPSFSPSSAYIRKGPRKTQHGPVEDSVCGDHQWVNLGNCWHCMICGSLPPLDSGA